MAICHAVSDALELVRDVVQATEHSEGPNAAPVLRSILSDTVLLTPDVQAVEIAIANTEAIPPADGQKPDKELADECWLPEEIANDPPEACPADIQVRFTRLISLHTVNPSCKHFAIPISSRSRDPRH